MKLQYFDFKNGGKQFQYHGDLWTIPSGRHPATEAFRDKTDPSKPDPNSAAMCEHVLKHFGSVRENGKLVTYVTKYVETVADPILPKDWNQAEVLWVFAGWLTSRPEVLGLGASKDALPAADAVAEFCKFYGFEDPREGWNIGVKLPPVAPGEVAPETSEEVNVVDTVLENLAEGKVPESHVDLGETPPPIRAKKTRGGR